MTWTKLSDDYSDDCWTLSDAAFRLHTEALIWSNRKLLDCLIPEDDVRRFKRPEAVTELLNTGWWTLTGGIYEINHHARYQRPREKVLNQQKVNRENRAKRGKDTPPAREIVSNDSFNESLRGNESLNGSNYERDRTGQAGQGLQASPKPEVQDEQVDLSKVDMETGEILNDSWPEVRVPGASSCEDCLPDGTTCLKHYWQEAS